MVWGMNFERRDIDKYLWTRMEQQTRVGVVVQDMKRCYVKFADTKLFDL